MSLITSVWRFVERTVVANKTGPTRVADFRAVFTAERPSVPIPPNSPTVLDRVSALKNNQLAVPHKLLSVVFFGTHCIWGFRARQHQRSLVPVINNLWRLSWPMISGDGWSLRFSSYSWGKTPKKPQPGKLNRPGIEPWPCRWEATMLPLDHSSGVWYVHINKFNIERNYDCNKHTSNAL